MKRDSRQVYSEYLVLKAQGGSDKAFGELDFDWIGEKLFLDGDAHQPDFT